MRVAKRMLHGLGSSSLAPGEEVETQVPGARGQTGGASRNHQEGIQMSSSKLRFYAIVVAALVAIGWLS